MIDFNSRFIAIINIIENKITALNGNLLVWSEKILGNANHKLHFQDEVQHNEENLSSSTQKISDLKARREKLFPEIKKRKTEYKNHERKYQKAKSDYGKTLRDQDQLKKQTETIFLKIREEEGFISRIKSSIGEIEQSKETQNEKISQTHQKLENSKANINLIRAEVEKQEKENGALSIEMNNLNDHHSKLEKNILALKEERSQLLSYHSTLQTQLTFYSNIIENHEGRPAGVIGILRDQKKYPFVMGVLSDIIEVDDPYKRAVESALGDYSNYLVVDSRNNAQKLIAESSHRLSIFALDSMPGIAAEKPGYSKIPLLTKIKSDAKVMPLLTILMGDVYILPSHKIEPDISSTCNWVSESGNYISRGFIYKSSGKKSESVIGRKHKIEQLHMELEQTIKQTRKFLLR